MTRSPLLIAHRTAMAVRPENTLAGIAAAIEAGADGVEVDVRATRDDVPVLMHDASLARTTGDPRRVADVTRDELRALRVAGPYGAAGPQPVPTLEEALAAAAPIGATPGSPSRRSAGQARGRQTLDAPSGALLVIEVKQPGIAPAVAGLVRAGRALDRCRLWSFDDEVCADYAAALPGVPVALLAGRDADPTAAIARAAQLGLAGVGLERSLVDAPVARSARAAGLALATWTANHLAEARRLRALGVDAICSDDPARLETAVRG